MRNFRRVIEWFLLLVLLGILFAIVSPKTGRGYIDTRDMAARAQIEAISTAMEVFRIDNGYFPDSTNVLEALLQPPAGATNWRGPYLMAEAGITNDPWETPFRFFVPGYHNTNSFDVISAGPDRRFYTEDDIGNWRFNIVAGRRTNL